jgi:RND family efflux transporter MFP subunit
VISRRFHAGIALLAFTGVFGLIAAGCAPRITPDGGAAADAAIAPSGPRADSAADPLTALETLAHVVPAEDDSFETALAPLREVEIVARVDGELVGVYFEEGRRVDAGTRLAQVDDRERRSTLDERMAEEARTEAAWKRATKLWDEKVISEEQFISARSDRQVAVAQRERAAIEWERCAVRAPIAGVIELRRAQAGQMVKQGDLLFRIGNPDTLRAELLVPESRLGTVKAGQRVLIVPAAGSPPRWVPITRVNPLVDPASGTFRVAIDIDNRSGQLHGGVSARVVFDPARAKPR